jgi:FkbM family methyltransferase
MPAETPIAERDAERVSQACLGATDTQIVSRLFLRILEALPPALYSALERLAGRRPFSLVGRKAVRRLRQRASVATIRHGAAAGMRIRSAGPLSVPLGRLEPFVQEQLATYLRPGGVLFDIGANCGFMTLLGARLVGEHGLVIAFEPLAENIAMIEENLRLNRLENVVVMPVAAAAASGRATMLCPSDLTGASLVNRGGDSGAERREVMTLRVDEAVSSGRIPAPNVVKIDVEGAELEVIGGLHETFATARPVLICELHWVQEEIDGALTAIGYETIERWHDDGRPDWNSHIVALPRARTGAAPSQSPESESP